MVRNSSFCFRKAMLTSLTLLFCFICFGQVSVSGAKCVLTTLVYQYDIKGDWKENDKINICVEGGVFTESGNSCTEKQSLSSVKVKWSEGRSVGKITVTSQAGTANLTVNITSSLNPGQIETSSKQTVSFDKTPASLFCTQASGGSCSPTFSYQWEQSDNNLNWKPVAGATGRNLSFDTPLKQSTFFRRRVIEDASKSIGYSNAVAVFVTPAPPQKTKTTN